MRPIYCGHQQDSEERRGEETHDQTQMHKYTDWYSKTHALTCTPIQWHTWPEGGCVIAVCLTQPCVCCLDIYASLSLQHTHSHRQKLFLYCLSVTIHLPTNYTLIPSTPQVSWHQGTNRHTQIYMCPLSSPVGYCEENTIANFTQTRAPNIQCRPLNHVFYCTHKFDTNLHLWQTGAHALMKWRLQYKCQIVWRASKRGRPVNLVKILQCCWALS